MKQYVSQAITLAAVVLAIAAVVFIVMATQKANQPTPAVRNMISCMEGQLNGTIPATTNCAG